MHFSIISSATIVVPYKPLCHITEWTKSFPMMYVTRQPLPSNSLFFLATVCGADTSGLAFSVKTPRATPLVFWLQKPVPRAGFSAKPRNPWLKPILWYPYALVSIYGNTAHCSGCGVAMCCYGLSIVPRTAIVTSQWYVRYCFAKYARTWARHPTTSWQRECTVIRDFQSIVSL